jgi:hypothetical protein
MRLWRHMKALWPRHTLLPAAPFLLWAGFWAVRGQLRWDHVAMAIVVPLVAYGNAKTKRMFLGLLPVALVGLFYDAMRFVKNVGLREDNVHVCDLRGAELRIFGITLDGQRMTLQDWFHAHPSHVLDLLCAVPYGTFIFLILGYAVFLYFRDFAAQQRFTWGFLAMNLLGFATYHVYPAAPPWYFHTHGCVVDLAAHASEGARLAWVDSFIGVKYFAGMYGRSSDIYGAVPSLHVAYPLLVAIEGWRHHRLPGRVFLASFYVVMCFSAVYLDHHWVIDVIVGTAYTAVVAVVMRRIIAVKSLPQVDLPPTEPEPAGDGGEPQRVEP